MTVSFTKEAKGRGFTAVSEGHLISETRQISKLHNFHRATLFIISDKKITVFQMDNEPFSAL